MHHQPPPPPHRRPPLRPQPHAALREAQRLKEAGEYKEAARIFERLAKGAEERGIERAPFLYLQAAHCCLLSRQTERGVGLTSHGLRLLAREQRWTALYRAGTRAIEVLREHNQKEIAAKIQIWLNEQLADHPEARSTPVRTPTAQSNTSAVSLPEKCPYCGASLRSDQVLWIDDHSAECVYCGSSVSAE